MATERLIIKSKNIANVHVTSFSGGHDKGPCLQVSQGWKNNIALDRGAALQLAMDILKWAEENNV